jgi:hypothetical protein
MPVSRFIIMVCLVAIILLPLTCVWLFSFIIVNREYERLLGYSPRDIRFRLDPFAWRAFWRMQTLDEAIAVSRLFFRCMLGLESDFRMVSNNYHITTTTQ